MIIGGFITFNGNYCLKNICIETNGRRSGLPQKRTFINDF
ncbi:hypothetical protein MuYL_1824 [Mucilaginibacter xinganensis]|uniref:Uncharacterized protein n=1 Tax=Mucilaginibacter xinganensis TaxID=1234841 RepID=A0A223NVD2_9SPHI|nr:hypothetical protein MuYL_1824 [Mucilaginibacter xinganensis]